MHTRHVNESRIDLKNIWYFGNNRKKDLKLQHPKWYSPLFLTSSFEYAEQYSDYGVYAIQLKAETSLKILDFSKSNETRRLKWPKILIDKIKEGNNDLNSIAYDMYILAYNQHGQLMYIEDNDQWRQAAEYFKKKSSHIFINVEITSSFWGTEKDHEFLLQMWKDIYDAGFDGFTHVEFQSKIMALFNFNCIDRVSIKPVSKPLN